MPTREQLAELDAIIALLKEHPEKHFQRTYISRFSEDIPDGVVFTSQLDCGSAFCIAGAAVARAGISVRWHKSWWVDPNQPDWYASVTTTVDEDGFAVSIHDRARQLLGLTDEEATRLFSADNTMEDIERFRAGLEPSD